MRHHRIIFVFGLCVFLFGCSSIRETYIDTKTFKLKTKINLHKRQDDKRIEILTQCAKRWTYGELDGQVELRIIQCKKALQFDLVSHPALIIGVTNANDSIRILSYKYYENLSTNESIKVRADTSIDLTNELEMGLINRDLPIFLSKKKKEDKFYCNIKKTYFGVIEK